MSRSKRTSPVASKLLYGQAGFSLVEELVAIGLVGVGIVLLLAMIGTGTIGVTTHRDHTVGDGLARSQLELIKDAPYADDHTTYPAVSPPTGFSVSFTADDWDPASGDFTGTSDSGMQRITVTVSRGGDTVVELQDIKVNR
ncbi:MAG: hypothetical protein R3191_01455 [Anaerolineales bacterium]|nr:hypothetical protein [Anaerolineales bacterium]